MKQSWVVVILRFMFTLNTWQCKCKHGNGNNHLHSWFSDFSLRKIITLTKYTNFSSVVFHWIVCTLFHGKLTFGLPGIKMDEYTQWNNFTVVRNSSYSLLVQVLHALKPTNKNKKLHFAVTMQDRIENNNDFLENLLFTDEATFHVSGSVNRI